MSIHILHWIKEDLEGKGKRLEDYTLVELQCLLEDYKNKYNRQLTLKIKESKKRNEKYNNRFRKL